MSDEVVRYVDINDLDSITIYNIDITSESDTIFIQFYAIVRLGLAYNKEEYIKNPYLCDTIFDVSLKYRILDGDKYTYELNYKNDDYILTISDEYIDNLLNFLFKDHNLNIDSSSFNIKYYGDNSCRHIAYKYNDKDYMYIMCNGINSSITAIDPNIISIEPYTTEDYLISIFRKDNEGNSKFDKAILANDSDKITEIVKEYIAFNDVCKITIIK
jgi:hypothetical protein